MEVTGKTISVRYSFDEFWKLIPDEAWNQIEKAIMKDINTNQNEVFTSFDDTLEKEGHIDFLVSK